MPCARSTLAQLLMLRSPLSFAHCLALHGGRDDDLVVAAPSLLAGRSLLKEVDIAESAVRISPVIASMQLVYRQLVAPSHS